MHSCGERDVVLQEVSARNINHREEKRRGNVEKGDGVMRKDDVPMLPCYLPRA